MDYKKLHEDTINGLQQMVSCGKITVEEARGICADFVPESEDEKIRKDVLDFIRREGQHIDKLKWHKWIAWLKDYEQKPVPIQIGRSYKCINSPRYTCFKPGDIYKPGDEFLCSLMNFCSDCFEPIKVGDIIKRKNDGLEARVTGVDNRGFIYAACEDWEQIIDQSKWELVKQKSTDKIEPKFKVGDKIQYSKGCGTIMTIEKIENGEYIFGNNMGHTTIESGNTWHLVEQKPTCWSEEDEDILKQCLYFFNGGKGGISDNRRDEILNWLKSLKDRVQPKQEWKQENTGDLTDFENAMMHIGGSFFGENAGLDPNDTNVVKEQANFLLGLAQSKNYNC